MTISTPLTEMFGIDHPIVLAPMGGVSGGALAAAVSAAGGLGLIGGGYGDQDWVAEQFDLAGNQRTGVGFITWSLAEQPELLDEALAKEPAAVMLSFGDITPFAGKIKAAGATLICQEQTLEGARRAVAEGADIIVAQGTEAGGHGSSGRTTLSLVPAVVDAVGNTPVLAAGAISDGRGLAAALMLGAAGVLVGTRFFASQEALGMDAAKKRLTEAAGDETLRTRIFDIVHDLPWPEHFTGRAIANQFTEVWHGREAGLEAALDIERRHYQMAVADMNTDAAVVFAGEGLDLVETVLPASVIVESMAREAEKLLDKGARRN